MLECFQLPAKQPGRRAISLPTSALQHGFGFGTSVRGWARRFADGDIHGDRPVLAAIFGPRRTMAPQKAGWRRTRSRAARVDAFGASVGRAALAGRCVLRLCGAVAERAAAEQATASTSSLSSATDKKPGWPRYPRLSRPARDSGLRVESAASAQPARHVGRSSSSASDAGPCRGARHVASRIARFWRRPRSGP